MKWKVRSSGQSFCLVYFRGKAFLEKATKWSQNYVIKETVCVSNAYLQLMRFNNRMEKCIIYVSFRLVSWQISKEDTLYKE